MLPTTEEEINKKFNLKNINIDEFYDHIEKEISMDDYLEF